jgi:hypothetical protein
MAGGAEFRVAVIGAVAAILGAGVGGYVSFRVQDNQLSHEREQAIVDVRREAYASVLEAAPKVREDLDLLSAAALDNQPFDDWYALWFEHDSELRVASSQIALLGTEDESALATALVQGSADWYLAASAGAPSKEELDGFSTQFEQRITDFTTAAKDALDTEE